MPIIKSAIKRAKQTKVRTARNLATKRNYRSEIKSVEAAVAAKDGKKAAAALTSAQSSIDTAVKKNLIHKNKAARKKSQLSKLVKTVPGSAPSRALLKRLLQLRKLQLKSQRPRRLLQRKLQPRSRQQRRQQQRKLQLKNSHLRE